MVDDLKHLDEHSDEIRELVETLVQNQLHEAATVNQYCPSVWPSPYWSGPPSQRHARVPLSVRS